MASFEEASIKTFSGLSSETKPTIAAGNNVPNGSRWREVDTMLTYFYNKSNDTWYRHDDSNMVVRMDYDGDDLVYRGLNSTHKAATSATNWVVYKYTYTDSKLVMIEGPLVGSWDGRAALDWA
jgi:hypothetical protein